VPGGQVGVNNGTKYDNFMIRPKTPPVPAVVRRTRRRSAESQDELRGKLVTCAKALYREQGYDAVSIRTLTQAVGMSPMSFYVYFGSKQELIRHIWVDFISELLKALQAAGRGRRSPLLVLEAHADAYLAYWEAHPQQYRMIYMYGALQDDDEPVGFEGDPVYLSMVALTRERLLACYHGQAISEKALRLTADHMFVKALGYLHATLAIGRYKFADHAKLRRRVVKDIVETVHRASPPG
jgi:AcrR family transcriptional regulator